MTATTRPCFHHTDPFLPSTRTPLGPRGGVALPLAFG